MKNLYVYHSIKTNDDGSDDIAITEAENKADAVNFFKAYFNNASYKNVREIDCNSDGHKIGYAKNIMIVSKY